MLRVLRTSTRYTPTWNISTRCVRKGVKRGVQEQTWPNTLQREEDTPDQRQRNVSDIEKDWILQKEDTFLHHDSFISSKYAGEIDDHLVEGIAKDFLKDVSPETKPDQARQALEERLKTIKTVSQDFNERQRLQGNFGDDVHHSGRKHFNKEETSRGIVSEHQKDIVSRIYNDERRNVPSMASIIFNMMHNDPTREAIMKQAEKGVKQASQITLADMSDPVEIERCGKEFRKKRVTKFDVDHLLKDENEKKKLAALVHVTLVEEEEGGGVGTLPEQKIEEEIAEGKSKEKAEENTAKAPILSSIQYLLNSTESDPTSSIKIAGRLKVNATSRSESNQIPVAVRKGHAKDTRPDSVAFKPNGEEILQQGNGEWKAKTNGLVEPSEDYAKLLPFAMQTNDATRAADPNDMSSYNRYYAKEDLLASESHPFVPELNVLSIDVGSANNITLCDRATLYAAQKTKASLSQASTLKSEKEIEKEILAERSVPSTVDPLKFLHEMDAKKDIDDYFEEKEAEILQEESPQEEKEVLSEIDQSDDEEVDNLGELERILGDGSEGSEDVEEEPGTSPKERAVYNKVLKMREHYKLPDFTDLDVDTNSPKKIQKALQDFLLGDAKDCVEDDISKHPFFGTNEINDDNIIHSEEFLSKVKKAYGDAPPARVYNEGILSYVRSEHLRHATFLVADMKANKLTPSEDAYSAIIEAFYSNFDVTGGEAYKREMLQAYPSSTPPVLSLPVDGDYLKPTAL